MRQASAVVASGIRRLEGEVRGQARLHPPAGETEAFIAWIAAQRSAVDFSRRNAQGLALYGYGLTFVDRLRSPNTARLSELRRLAPEFPSLRPLVAAMVRRHVTRASGVPSSVANHALSSIVDRFDALETNLPKEQDPIARRGVVAARRLGLQRCVEAFRP
jgi:hypothetical protein